MPRIVILGAGTAGTIMANRLARQHRSALDARTMSITVVDEDAHHIYQPGLLFLPFGLTDRERLVKPRTQFLPRGVQLLQAAIDRVEPDEALVRLSDGLSLPYDVLVIATGSRIAPGETEGLDGPGWRERTFDFYTLEGADALRRALASWAGGRLVVNVVEMPIKCPVAPLEFAFLADWYFTERGIRDAVDITYATPLDGAFTKPIAASHLGELLERKQIRLETEFNTGSVDGVNGRLVSWDDRVVDFDLLVSIPVHAGAEYIGRTEGLGDEMQFVLTDHRTLQADRAENIFALGDATNLPSSKAGSVAHFQADVLTENIGRYLAGERLEPGFDGHANCFVETGFDKALLIDFNYDIEPLPGRFPLPVVGPMRLLEESRLNHLGKRAFEWIYWNVLMRGKDIPGISTKLSMRGKVRRDREPSAA